MGMRSVLFGAILWGAVGCGGAGGPQKAVIAGPGPNENVGTVLAKIDGQPVGSTAFLELALRSAPEGGEYSPELRQELLDQLVTDELLFQEAFQRALYRDPKVKKILVNLLLRDQIYANVKNSEFTDEQLRAYFESHKSEFVVPEKRQVRRIFIRAGTERTMADARTIAAGIIAKLNTENFATLASEQSEDPYKRRGGDLGFIDASGKPGVEPEVVAESFRMQVGQLSTEPFMSPQGASILYVANQRERLERTFDQMKGSVLRRMKNESYEKLTDEFVAKLRTSYKVDVDAAALAGLKIEPPKRTAPPAPNPAVVPGQPEEAGEVDAPPMEEAAAEAQLDAMLAPPPPPDGAAAEPEGDEGAPK
jgi:peptidyl-prolyl cis-trans isomerase C